MCGHCPFMTLNCLLTTSFPLDWSCPFHSFQLPLHVPVICPLHFPCISRSFVASHFPTSPVVSIGFLVLPFHSPCTPLVFISVPFMSLSVPLCFPFISPCFPVMSTSYFLPSFSCTSLSFPFSSPVFPRKINTVFPAFSQKGCQKTQSFSRSSAKGGRKPKPAKSRQGDSSLDIKDLYAYVHMHIFMYVYTHMHRYAYTHTHVYIYIYICAHFFGV